VSVSSQRSKDSLESMFSLATTSQAEGHRRKDIELEERLYCGFGPFERSQSLPCLSQRASAKKSLASFPQLSKAAVHGVLVCCRFAGEILVVDSWIRIAGIQCLLLALSQYY
jgi:hypothetical protein